jgi:hypothetical protein
MNEFEMRGCVPSAEMGVSQYFVKVCLYTVGIYTLYILQNDAVQQLSVLPLITQLTGLPTLPVEVFLRRRSRRMRRGSSGLDWGVASACSQRPLP